MSIYLKIVIPHRPTYRRLKRPPKPPKFWAVTDYNIDKPPCIKTAHKPPKPPAVQS